MKNVFVMAALMLLATVTAKAQLSDIFATDGKAIKGYDAVAFFKEAKPVKGSDSLAYTYKGVQWLFSSKENMDTFSKHPEHFVPQYGGYCAYGASQGHKAPTETNTFTVVNNMLYFNYNAKVKAQWLKDQPALIEKANKQWPIIKDKE